MNIFIDEFGEDVDHFLNVNKLLESQAVLNEVRPIIERRIANDYLPGFTFEDDHHALWWMKQYSSWATWVSNYALTESQWDETWSRMILVPKRHHYIAEVAAALQRYDRNTEDWIREYNAVRSSGDKKNTSLFTKKMHVVRALRGLPPGPVKGQRHKMAMMSWPNRLRERFAEFKIPENDTSVMRLATNADRFRTERLNSSPPSGWRIKQLTYFGSLENPNTDDPESWNELMNEYFEAWEWCGDDSREPPRRTSLTFLEPAVPGLWQRKWKKNKRRFRD